jgi:FkbM family methyltransferase
MKFYSQAGQDQFVFHSFFRGRRDGVFVDIGAHDGATFSNSLFFEQFLGWRGLCVEPRPEAFAKLKASRRAACEQACVAEFEGEAEFVEGGAGTGATVVSGLVKHLDQRRKALIDASAATPRTHTMPVRTLPSLLAAHGLFHVDYCSIGAAGAEVSILSHLDPARFDISVLTVADHYGDDRLLRLMAAKGYDAVARLAHDLVFKRRGFAQQPNSSVICAVWHGDPARLERLRGHLANLKRQTVPVEPIYVFDGGDAVPNWLEARAVSVREHLTIYQAWNVALSLVATPLVMNLNLDDRLAPDAVQVLEHFLHKENAVAVGGDWNIRYSPAETDAVEPCRPALDVPVVGAWPPAPGEVGRLGSGTGENASYGPAVMWRMEAHLNAPRYPWRFGEGTLVRKLGDLAWWKVLVQHQHKKIARAPVIIGNYHSHPGDQAEFRALPHDEAFLLQEVGVSPL